jgi:hypothetical protein
MPLIIIENFQEFVDPTNIGLGMLTNTSVDPKTHYMLSKIIMTV